MKLQPKYIQIIGDAIIPLLGFFMWNWSLYFILLFYLLDILVKETVIQFKSKKIIQFQGEQLNVKVMKKKWLRYFLISFILLTFSLFVIFQILIYRETNFSFIRELIAFWEYKDMGFSQGYILIPLVVIMGFMQYKNEFIMPRIFEFVSIEKLWNKHITSLIVLLGFSSLFFGLIRFVNVADSIIVLAIISLSSVYQFWEIKRNSK